jgi:hypothetical protein
MSGGEGKGVKRRRLKLIDEKPQTSLPQCVCREALVLHRVTRHFGE